MEDLLKKQISNKGRITRIRNDIQANSVGYSLENVVVHLEKLEDLWNRAESYFQDIVVLCANENEIEHNTEKFDLIYQLYHDVKAKLLILQTRLTVPKPTPPPTATVSTRPNVKLPVISIPQFDGKYEQWSSFQDLFVSTIDKDSTLTDSQKLQYLKSFVTGEPEKLIRSLNITNANYSQAWTLLKNRYDNSREIVFSLFRRLFSQRTLTKESSSDLQQLLDTTNECLTSLKNQNQPVQHWDSIMVYLTAEKLDPESRKQWAIKLSGSTVPKFDKLKEFIEQHVRGLQASVIVNQPAANVRSSTDKRSASTFHGHAATMESRCVVCSGDHPLYKCEQFRSKSTQQRVDIVRHHKLCFNCIRDGHRNTECRSHSWCKSPGCNKRHHTMLHYQDKRPEATSCGQTPGSSSGATAQVSVGSHIAASEMNSKHVLFGTAIVRAHDRTGAPLPIRVMLDSACQSSLMSEKCASFLGLPRRSSNVIIHGINGSDRSKGELNLRLNSYVNDKFVDITVQVINSFTSKQPKFECEPLSEDKVCNTQLADPNYYIPDKVDILLGVDYLSEVLLGGIKTSGRGNPMAQHTIFGWVISGPVSYRRSVTIHHTECEKILTRFWEVEELPADKILSPSEQQCEEHFVDTHERDENGRFVVKLPLNEKISELGYSRQQAVKRLVGVERRLQAHPEYRKQYNDFMLEYLNLSHMEPVPLDERQEVATKTYYLPHHFVLKPDSTSTKFRVVFDGSARSSSGISLNDCMLTGAKQQDDIFALLLRFRRHPVALKADVPKMFRQFVVSTNHRDLQRILWRFNPNDPITDYRLTTVTYGTAAAPFLSTRCIKQLAQESMDSFPTAAQKLNEDVYVDDLITSVETVDKAKCVYNELAPCLNQAGLELKKWCSNSDDFLQIVPIEQQEKSSTQFDCDSAVKALGVQWEPTSDVFFFSGPESPCETTYTKRKLLSDMARVYDPLGLITPFTIRAKILFQELWKSNMDWDDQVPNDILCKWEQYNSEFTIVKSIKMNRCLVAENCEHLQLHAFGDASERAYAACVYLSSINRNSTRTVRLIATKSKVAPIQQLSIARLELCASLLCAQLVMCVKLSLKLDCEIFAYTDSSITLHWIRGLPSRWKTFVGNRVSKIQKLVPASHWSHCPGVDNPADLASRGVSADELKSSSLWWSGPAWLIEESRPSFPEPPCEESEAKTKPVLSYTTSAIIPLGILFRYSNMYKIQRIIALCIRFVQNCKGKVRCNTGHEKATGQLSPTDLSNAMNLIVKCVQSEGFPSEVNALKIGKPLHVKSKLASLTPFLDGDGVLRVGGRLHRADLPVEHKHPAIIPNNHRLAELLIYYYHLKYLHAGYQLLWCNLQREFWIVGARQRIRSFVRSCVKCRRHRGEVMQQLMGNLPSARVKLDRPFSNVGIDCAGPFTLRVIKGRGNKLTKGYFTVFVCMATKAIHLEPVGDMSTETFIAALTRFVSRRGLCNNIYSDCGTNFVGADNTLKELWESQSHYDQVDSHLIKNSIKFHRNPPGGAHHGGLMESGVKQVKHHLYRVIGTQILTFEEFQTILCQVEACVNSRPLCPMSTDPSDARVLTPAHFLIGGPLAAVPQVDLTQTPTNRLSRWQLTTQINQHFWKRWHEEYLSSLQQRNKWKRQQQNLKVNDIVLVTEETHGPLQWRMGRVVAVHPGEDGLVRVATIRTASSEIKRPITKLCPLITSESDY